MLLKGCTETAGQNGHAIFFALAIAHDNGALGKVNILHAQACTFHQAQTAAVEEVCHQALGA